MARTGAARVSALTALLLLVAAAEASRGWQWPAQLARWRPSKTAAVEHKADCKTVFNVLEERDDLSILAAAVKAAGLDDTLDDEKAVLTVFAPVDDAFVELLDRLKMTKEQLLENKILLVRVLDYHVVPGVAAMENDLSDGQKLATLARMPPLVGPRENVTVRIGADDSIVLDGLGSDAKVIETDIVACASVVHIIDTVLLPDKLPGLEAFAVA